MQYFSFYYMPIIRNRKYLMKNNLLKIIFFGVVFCSAMTGQQLDYPDWVYSPYKNLSPKKYFVSVGIGSDLESARRKGAADIAAQALVRISSKLTTVSTEQVVDDHSSFSENTESDICSYTNLVLKDINLHDQWYSGDEYFLLLSVSKAGVMDEMESEFQQVKLTLEDAAIGGYRLLQSDKPTEALKQFLQGVEQTRSIMAKAFTADVQGNGTEEEVINALKRGITKILANLTIDPIGSEQSGRLGQGLQKSLGIKVNYRDDSNKRHPLKGVPITVEWKEGTGKLQNTEFETNINGIALTNVLTIEKELRKNILIFSLDLERLIPKTETEPCGGNSDYDSFIQYLSGFEKDIWFSSKPVKIAINNIDGECAERDVKKKVSEWLSNNNILVRDIGDDVDYTLDIEYETEKSSFAPVARTEMVITIHTSEGVENVIEFSGDNAQAKTPAKACKKSVLQALEPALEDLMDLFAEKG